MSGRNRRRIPRGRPARQLYVHDGRTDYTGSGLSFGTFLFARMRLSARRTAEDDRTERTHIRSARRAHTF